MSIRPDITPEKVISFLKMGVSTTRIAWQLQCGRNMVYTIAKKGGWKFTEARLPKKLAKKCACCGVRPVPKPKKTKDGIVKAPVLKMLCNRCYANISSEEDAA
ncbi:MAG: hypothetical protein HQK65_07555 [Desulfamplus sp.]|nr:hypothetical protein [Desulfamplus sp.]